MELEAVDISQTASAADMVFDVLRKAIIEGSLGEGEHLRQDRIARMFNTSRIPVREALARLERDGLVTTERYKGTTVAGLSSPEIEEIFEFRALLESEVIRLAVPCMDAKVLNEARRHLEAFARERNPARWGEINRDFHYGLYKAAARPYHLQVISSTFDRVDRYLRAQLTLTSGMKKAREEHEAILAACSNGDAWEAASLTRAHILDAGRALIAYLEDKRSA